MQSVNIIYVNYCTAILSFLYNVDARDRIRDDKESIFFAILLMLNILCDIVHDVIDKHVYVRLISLIGQSNSFENDWLRLLQWRVDMDTLNSILINVLGTADMVLFMCHPVVLIIISDLHSSSAATTTTTITRYYYYCRTMLCKHSLCLHASVHHVSEFCWNKYILFYIHLMIVCVTGFRWKYFSFLMCFTCFCNCRDQVLSTLPKLSDQTALINFWTWCP